jgi:hypothetical protein
MTIKVYRGWTRIVLLVFGMGFNALFFAGATVLAWGHAWAVVCGIGVTSLFTAFAMRIPFARIVATTEGIKIHATVATTFISWSAVTRVWSAEIDREGGLISVYCPLVTVAGGRVVELTPMAVYRRAAARRVADELEELRQAWTGTPSEIRR